MLIATLTALYALAPKGLGMVQVWSKTMPRFMSPTSIVDQVALASGPFPGQGPYYDLHTGKELPNFQLPSGAAPASKFGTGDGFSEPLGAFDVEGRTFQILWQSDSMGIGANARYAEVVQFDPKTKTLNGRVHFPVTMMFSFFQGKPEQGIFRWSFGTETMSHYGYSDYILFMSPLRISAAPLVGIHDARDLHSVLGVSLKKGMTRGDFAGMASPPSAPLTCCDAYSGKVHWSRSDLDFGVHVRKYVLAKQAYRPAWQFLEAATGKTAGPPLVQLAGYPKSEVGASGDYIYTFTHFSAESPKLVVTCYRMVAEEAKVGTPDRRHQDEPGHGQPR